MDLSTDYLGLSLPHPLMPGASPLASDMDRVRRLEDAGAAAIVLHSLFEEQLLIEQIASAAAVERQEEAFSEMVSYFSGLERFRLTSDEYLEQLRRIRDAVSVPVIASLNGISLGGWLDFAGLLQQAGAHALELNVYDLATDPDDSGQNVEQRAVEMVREVKKSLTIPVAVKLSPFYSSLAHFARLLGEAGAEGLVLFNRFHQPDIDVEQLEVVHRLRLSDPGELLLRLRWLAILSGRGGPSLAASGGVHDVEDVVKCIMAGADAVQIVSVLLREGPERLAQLRSGLAEWLESHGHDSLDRIRCSMNLSHCPDPKAYERANYMEILQSWSV